MRTQENMNMVRSHLAKLSTNNFNKNSKNLKNSYTVQEFVCDLLSMDDDKIYETYSELDCYRQQEFENIIQGLNEYDQETLDEGFMSGLRSEYEKSKNAGINREKNVRVRKLMAQPISRQLKAAFQNRVSTPIGKKVGDVKGKIRTKISSVISNFASRSSKSPRNKQQKQQAVKLAAKQTPQATKSSAKKPNRRVVTVRQAVSKIKKNQSTVKP